MNWFDVLILIILGVFIFWGFHKGFLGEIVALAGLILALFFAAQLMDQAARLLLKWMKISPELALAGGFLLVFLLTFILVNLFGLLLRHLVKTSPLAFFDRLGGVVFGLIKGTMFLSVLLLLLLAVPLPPKIAKPIQGSKITSPLRQIAPSVYTWTKNLLPRLQKYYQQFREMKEKIPIRKLEDLKKIKNLENLKDTTKGQ
ncbi:MAG: CvpA family protein [Candidatus Edwardsbacteria bacterium]